MMFKREHLFHRSVAAAAMAIAVSISATPCFAQTAELNSGKPAVTKQPVTWLDSLDAGYLQAQKTQRPLLVLVAETRSGPVPQWSERLSDPAIALKLANWILVRLGPDAKEARRQLGIATTPALCVVSAKGSPVDQCNALLTVEELAKWLDTTAAKASPPAVVGGDIAGLIARLGAADAESREAAARQLASRRAESASAVIDALAGEDTTARLAAADVLDGWHSPMQGIDPWQRKTVTVDRLKLLHAWASASASAVPTTTAPSNADDRNASDMNGELDALLSAGTNAEARAVRERMVRFGESILPLVHQRLRETRSEQTHFRLTSLRYRVVATDALAGKWPGGFDRLAASDSAMRRVAVDELGKNVTADDGRLLLELFGDDDPLVREKSLILLKTIRGPKTNEVLIHLLADPEANVRAAVLKSLAEDEKIDPALADKLLKYIVVEKDPDLVIHAIHVLKNTSGEPAATCLISLLLHPEWRVRAEATEVLTKKLERSYGEDELAANTKVSGYAAIIKLLNDEEGFVVSRAVAALSKSRLASAVEPMIRATERHPELAGEVVRMIAGDNEMSKAALPKLRPWMTSARPELRAAAIKAICLAGPESAQQELTIALSDADASVRAAGLEGVVSVINSQRPRDGYVTRNTGFLGMGGSQRVKVDFNKWLDDYRGGKVRYRWLAALQPTLKSQAGSETGSPQINAAIALCALGQDQDAMPVLLNAAKLPAKASEVSEAFAWLPWEPRKKLFDAVIGLNDPAAAEFVIGGLARMQDRRAADLIWPLIKPDSTDDMIDQMYRSIRGCYFGSEYYNESAFGAEDKKAASQSALKQIESGNEPQRVVALAMLELFANDEAAQASQKLLADKNISDPLRRDAIQIRLLSLDAGKAIPEAVAAAGVPVTRGVAIRYLANGGNALRSLRNGSVSLGGSHSYGSWNSGDKVDLSAPAGLTADTIRPALNDPDPQTAAYAGYLLVLAGDPKGLESLEPVWRKEGLTDDPWMRLVYRAVTRINDDKNTKILEEIYKAVGRDRTWELREFYWTIRSMTGENILKLRKKIRDEVGMDNLRS